MTIIIFLSVHFPAHGQMPLDPLRGLIWGLPVEAVKNFETALFVGEEDKVLVYSTIIRPDPAKRSYTVLIEYRFDTRGLSRIRYDIPVNRGSPREAFDDVMTWQLWFDDIFTQASEPYFTFRSPNVRNDPERWGWSIYRGDSSMRINWEDENTRALLSLTGHNYYPRLTVTLSPAQPGINY